MILIGMAVGGTTGMALDTKDSISSSTIVMGCFLVASITVRAILNKKDNDLRLELKNANRDYTSKKGISYQLKRVLAVFMLAAFSCKCHHRTLSNLLNS